jgi:glutaredoxin-like YruB-family protein
MRGNAVSRVVLYTQPGCGACATAKKWLTEKKIDFQEKDIRADDEAKRELVEDLQSRSTPTLVVGDKVLMGFDAEEYQRALGAGGES